MAPQAPWTAAHLKLPILVVMDNNEPYDNSVAHALKVAESRDRDPDDGVCATLIDEPTVDFPGLVRSFGVAGFGPVRSAAPTVLEEALRVVGNGQPALVDVLTSRTERGLAR